MFGLHQRLIAGGLLCTLLSLFPPAWLWWSASQDRDGWQLPQVIREYGAALRRQQQLEHQKEVVLWRTRNRKQLIGELMAGRVSFLQAAAGFKYLHENPPEQKAPPLLFPGATIEEKTCRQVIHFVEGYLSSHPETDDQAFPGRLRKELAELLARPEGLQLPTAAGLIADFRLQIPSGRTPGAG